MNPSNHHTDKGNKQTSAKDASMSNEQNIGTVSSGMGLLADVTSLAWNLVIPIVGGVLLGNYLDNRYDAGLTWTLGLLVLGVLIAFSNLYNLYIEHGRDHLGQDKVEETHAVTKDEDEE